MTKRKLLNVDDVVQTTDNTLDEISEVVSKVAQINKNKTDKIQVSVYLDEDVHIKYKRVGKVAGKGARSELINELLRKALVDY